MLRKRNTLIAGHALSAKPYVLTNNSTIPWTLTAA